MKRILLLVALLLGLTGIAISQNDQGQSGDDQGQSGDNGQNGDDVTVPEPNDVLSAIALFGGTAVVMLRRRPK